jgi:hypothetical protein
MKGRRLALGSFTAAMVAASVFLTVSRSTADEELDEIVRAYKADPAVATEIESNLNDGYRDRDARAVVVSGSCGVAGCSVEFLVVHLFSTPGVNPQTKSILARVRAFKATGKPTVELVELGPKPRAASGDGRAPSGGKIRVIGAVPTPTPDMPAAPAPRP